MNAELKADGTVELRIEREFSYPPEKVFEAWLRPEQLAQWMGPSDEINVANVQLDAVEGGHYQMEFTYAEGGGSQLNGVYKTIQRYTKLVFTWAWDKSEEDGGNEETLVTLEFTPTDVGTRLNLLHEKFTSAEIRDRHGWGWNETFDKLERRAQQIFAD